MGRKVKRLKNYTTEQVEALFESDENNIAGVKLCHYSAHARLQHTKAEWILSRYAQTDLQPGRPFRCGRDWRFANEAGQRATRFYDGRAKGSRQIRPVPKPWKVWLQHGKPVGSTVTQTFGDNLPGVLQAVLRLCSVARTGVQLSAYTRKIPGKGRKTAGSVKIRYKKTLAECTENPDTAVLFQDEFSLSNTATLTATRAKKGRQPLVDCKQARKERVTGFGSVNPLTGWSVVNFAEARGTQKLSKNICERFYGHIALSVRLSFSLIMSGFTTKKHSNRF